jgi:hypothetical protein
MSRGSSAAGTCSSGSGRGGGRDRGGAAVGAVAAAGGAVCLGQAYNPRMNAEGVVYDFARGEYTEGVVLGV